MVKKQVAQLTVKEKLLNFLIKVKQKLTKIWQIIKTNENKVVVVLIMTLLIMIGIVIAMPIYYHKKYDNKKVEYFTQEERIERYKQLKVSWQKFKNMSAKEKHFRWVRMFENWRYENGGDYKARKADCIGSIYRYFQSLDSNFELESVDWLIKRVENLNEQNACQLREKNLSNIESGDLMILVISESNKHVGMVIDVTPTGVIRYNDMNVGTMTWGFESIRFGDSRIRHIAEMSFALWAGDFIQVLSR